MTIRARLGLGLFAIALVLLLPLALALKASRDLDASTRSLRDHEFVALGNLNRVRTGLDEVRRAETNVGALAGVLARDSAARYSALDTLDARVDSLRAPLAQLRHVGLTSYADQIERALSDVTRLTAIEYRLARADSGVAALQLSQDSVLPAIVRVENAARDGERSVAGHLGMRVREAGIAADEAQEVSQVAFIAATVLAVVIAIALWRSIAGPLRTFEAGMAAVAGGHFNHELPIPPDRQDEFGRLAASFRSMADQLAQLDRLKAEFISVASHELKTPINVILGYVQLLAEDVYGPITERQCDVLRTIEAQTQSLARLVHQLLDISRFEAGGGKLEPRVLEVGRFLNDLEQTFWVLSIQRGIQFRVERGDSLPETVYWDADRINEVLGNLLANAFKFTDRGGSVWLRVEQLDGDIRILVSDTGAGIPPDQLPHVFEKFYQASNQEAAAQSGSGLGLAIVQQIVVAHGGTIAVHSQVGVGTTFELTLPARAGHRVSAERGPLPVRRTA